MKCSWTCSSELLFLGLAIAVSGCETSKPLTIAAGEPSAKLRYATNVGDVTQIHRFNLDACPSKVTIDSVANTAPGLISAEKELSTVKMIGSSNKEEARIRERVIPANKPFVFKLWAFASSAPYTPGYSCENYGVFLPTSGKEYEIFYAIEQKGILSPECNVVVSELQLAPDGSSLKRPEASFRSLEKLKGTTAYCGTTR